MRRDLTNKHCECGRPAVAWTAGDYACQICLDLQYASTVNQRSEKLRSLSKAYETRSKRDETRKYGEAYRVMLINF